MKIKENISGSINIFDSPGFTLDGKSIKDVEDFINLKFQYFKENHDYIHAFLYFFDGGAERTLEKIEIELLDYIQNKQKEYRQDSIVLFIINKSKENDEINANSFKQKLLTTLKNNFGDKSDYSKPENIIELNLKTKNDKKKFGIEKVFCRLYNFFIPHQVILPFKKKDGKEEEFEIIKKNYICKSMFFKYIQNEEQIYERCKISFEGLIKRYSEMTKNFAKEGKIEEIKNTREKMMEEMKKKFNSNIPLLNFEELNKNEIYDGFWSYFPFIGDYFIKEHMSQNSPNITKNIGNEYIKKHFETMKNSSNLEFVKSCIEIYNNSIQVIKNLSLNKENEIKEKTYISDNYFVIELKTNFINPKIMSHKVEIIGENYFFKFKLTNPETNESTEVKFLKNVIEKKKKNLQRDHVDKKDNLIKIFFLLNNEKEDENILED